jgi:aspartyl protease family protein
MFARPLKVFALTIAYLACSGLPGLQASEEVPTYQLYSMTELKAQSNGHYYATADINGSDIKVVIDTGATAVALPYEDAERAGLRPRNLNFSVPISTANGVVNAAQVELARVTVDGVRVDGVQGLVMPKGALNITLLGMSYLSKLRGFKVEEGVLSLKN